MTTAEMLRAEGRVEGLADTLVRQLTRRFGPLPTATIDLIHAASAEQLQAWLYLVLDATTIDEVLSRS